MKRILIPAILVQSEAEAFERLASIGKLTWIQIDALDGTLYPNTSWFDAKAVARRKPSPDIELHLMVMDPSAILDAWKNVRALKRVIWHVEAPIDHEKLIQRCHRMKREAVLAIAPQTPIRALLPYLGAIDGVLVLGVEPGFSGQSLIRSTLKKVRDLKKIAPSLPIGFDGGVNKTTIDVLKKAGVDRFCVASALWKAKDPEAELIRLTQKI